MGAYLYAGHTPADWAMLARAGLNTNAVQPREHAVPCQQCRQDTMNLSAHCDAHYQPPARAVSNARRFGITL